MKAFASTFSFIFALCVVLFAVSNRDLVVLELWPLPFSWAVSLYVPVMVALIAGFAAGMVASWALGAQRRKQARQNKERIRSLERLINQGKPAE